MPYNVEGAGGSKFKVVNKETGNVHSKATTHEKAMAQVRLLHGVEHGMKPRTTREVMGREPATRSKGEGSKSHGSKSRQPKSKGRK